jgi:signal transduction histidine kinase
MADCRSQVKKGNNEIKIKLISKAKDVFVKADKARIYQVIMNLLSNAIKFSQQGGIIIIMVEKPGTNNNPNNNQILVKVKDNGEGIDAQIFPTLFTKFATKSQTRGTGLGLFICKGIIEAHGGRIWAENNNLINGEKGATFYFSLPVLSIQEHNMLVNE